MNFAAFESRANQSVLRHLANCTVSIAGKDSPGIFTDSARVAELGIGFSTTQPTVQVASIELMAEPVGKMIAVDGKQFTIGAADPDGTGLTLVTLEYA